ncbi:MAG: DNA mismatch repair endonuclease MutL [Peptoniphilus sp.]|nr:DNA mismatch repair endonuclease MutL [Peptoniphilus sp.]MDD7363000.1 DNA mismatch repair endonuclease MutL [Bacillota bacterium]MDY6044240.1 DNA mismatch repair endonuclease MutL [Peptoniphilus sp.]
MNEILALNERTISQIAAGEIVENPASIIKELVENAIDARAKNISIRLSKNILDEIRVADDGEGIPSEQVARAFSRHATSKLRTISDLGQLTSLGFRGEALASIANISYMTCITKTDDEDFAYKYDIEGPQISKGVPIGAPKGTTMIVRDIFYNTPVRKRFLSAASKEIREITRVVEVLALSRQDISIHLIWDRKTLLQSHASENTRNHIYSILGKDIAKNLIPIEFDTESYQIEGYVSNNLVYRSSPEREYLFINGRGVKSDAISAAVRKPYRSLIPLNHYPVFVLYIDIDPLLIDVNIHPQKQTVRLSNNNQITVLLERLVASALSPRREIPTVERFEPKKAAREEMMPSKTIFQLSREREERRGADRNESDESKVGKEIKSDHVYEEETSYGCETSPEQGDVEEEERRSDPASMKKPPLDVELYNYLGIVFRTYILFENKRDGRLLVVDQHAAHERVLYEKYSRDIENRSVATQLLLTPIQIHLSVDEMQMVEEHLDEYRILGFEPEPFGEDTVVIREVPEHILIADFRQFFLDSIKYLDRGVDVKEQNIYKIMRLACRSAIKGGDKLSEIEAYDLLKQLNEADTPFTCPHGRPTMVHLEKRTFEKLFLREGA